MLTHDIRSSFDLLNTVSRYIAIVMQQLKIRRNTKKKKKLTNHEEFNFFFYKKICNLI
jgi:hypothetical protein